MQLSISVDLRSRIHALIFLHLIQISEKTLHAFDTFFPSEYKLGATGIRVSRFNLYRRDGVGYFYEYSHFGSPNNSTGLRYILGK